MLHCTCNICVECAEVKGPAACPISLLCYEQTQFLKGQGRVVPLHQLWVKCCFFFPQMVLQQERCGQICPLNNTDGTRHFHALSYRRLQKRHDMSGRSLKSNKVIQIILRSIVFKKDDSLNSRLVCRPLSVFTRNTRTHIKKPSCRSTKRHVRKHTCMHAHGHKPVETDDAPPCE